MSLKKDEWEEYRKYLEELTPEELEIEKSWLKSVGEAKKRGSSLSLQENNTIQ
jgi:hypothetical protein